MRSPRGRDERRAATRASARHGAAAALAGLILLACAQPGIPPGGPVDRDPPALVGVSPDTGSVNVRPKSVMIRFDEVINERSTPLASAGARPGAGAMSSSQLGSTLGALVLVSPGDGRERVSWRRTAIEIEPRGGFRPNTTYRVTLLPGLGDLRGNTLKERVDIVFSTGAARTTGSISGAIFDWVLAKPMGGARIEVFAPADSTLRWSTAADANGRFSVRDLAPGTYRLRGWTDIDADRTIDAREVFDTLTVTVDTAAKADLYAFTHDTLGPRIEAIEPVDSTALRVRLDRAAATDWVPEEATALLLRSDSSQVGIVRMLQAAAFDSLRAAAEARADSIAAAADTTAKDTARADTAAAAPRRAPPRIQTLRTGSDTLPQEPPPVMQRPAPATAWVIEFREPLAPGRYLLKLRGIRGLTGYARPSEREFTLRPPTDSTARPSARPGAPATRPPAARPPETRPPR